MAFKAFPQSATRALHDARDDERAGRIAPLRVTVGYVQADTVSEVEPSLNHPVLKYVVARIGHFSSYAVAY